MRIIILHGWAYNTDKWQPLLASLKKQNIVVEFPSIPVLTEKTDKVWAVNDYMAWLKHIIGNDKVVLIGHSNGGRLALNFTSRYPSSVSKLILIDSAGIPRTELTYRIKRGLFWMLAKLGKPLARFSQLRRLLYKLARVNDYLEANPLARTTMANLLASDYSLELSNIVTPVSIIWGANDKLTPLKDAYTFSKKLKNAEPPIVISDARHAPQFTHPDLLAELIIKALPK